MPQQGKPISVVTETRERVYSRREKANPAVSRVRWRTQYEPYPDASFRYPDRQTLRPPDPGGVGWEIAHEASCCAPCAYEHANPTLVLQARGRRMTVSPLETTTLPAERRA